MKRMIDIKEYPSRKVLTTVSVVLMIAYVGITTVCQIPTTLATPLEEIKVSREVSAPIDKVWNIVSDIDSEAKYWSVIKNIKYRQDI